MDSSWVRFPDVWDSHQLTWSQERREKSQADMEGSVHKFAPDSHRYSGRRSGAKGRRSRSWETRGKLCKSWWKLSTGCTCFNFIGTQRKSPRELPLHLPKWGPIKAKWQCDTPCPITLWRATLNFSWWGQVGTGPEGVTPRPLGLLWGPCNGDSAESWALIAWRRGGRLEGMALALRCSWLSGEVGWGKVMEAVRHVKSCSTRDQLELQVTRRTHDVIRRSQRQTTQPWNTVGHLHPPRHHLTELKEEGRSHKVRRFYVKGTELFREWSVLGVKSRSLSGKRVSQRSAHLEDSFLTLVAHCLLEAPGAFNAVNPRPPHPQPQLLHQNCWRGAWVWVWVHTHARSHLYAISQGL